MTTSAPPLEPTATLPAAANAPVVLIVDDHAPSRTVARHAVAPIGAEVVEAGSAAEAWGAIALRRPDVILLDLMMPDVDGMTFARQIRADERLCEVPILMITAATGRAERLAALESGVDDFIGKPVDRIELRARVSTACRLARFRKLVEERQRGAALMAMAPIGVVVMDAATSVVRVLNERAARWLPGAAVDAPLFDALEAAPAEQLRTALASGRTQDPAAARLRLASGTQLDAAIAHVQWEGMAAVQVILTDVTALARVEEQLHRRDRLDAVGRLAASVAHDFASVVQVCKLHVHRAQMQPLTTDAAEALQDVSDALRRGGLMTQDLLRFCRRPDANASQEACDATEVLRNLQRLLSRLSPLAVQTEVRLPDHAVHVPLAAHELEQAVVNLVSNARDALYADGRIEVVLERGQERAALWVRDNGIGMPPEVEQRAGEPFFSTKEAGQGTGLGLWMVRRVLEAAGGSVRIESRAGHGTTVTLDLPLTSAVR